MNQTERLEQYFQTVVKHLPGGMAVIRHEVGGVAAPEYLSDGFSEMLDMPKEAAWKMYQKNALSGVHPDDRGPSQPKDRTRISCISCIGRWILYSQATRKQALTRH